MKILASLFLVLLLNMSVGCSMHKEPASVQAGGLSTTPAKSNTIAAEKYVLVLDELISNGCNVSSFELVERNKSLDMKISCK